LPSFFSLERKSLEGGLPRRRPACASRRPFNLPRIPRLLQMASCRLCKRECAPSSTLCAYHLAAKGNLESGYKLWSEAYGGMEWKEYLRRVGHRPETGQWAKEVAELLYKETAE
jgi:hypothetical protein